MSEFIDREKAIANIKAAYCGGFITNWPWNMVAAFPENLPVWMPTPKKPR